MLRIMGNQMRGSTVPCQCPSKVRCGLYRRGIVHSEQACKSGAFSCSSVPSSQRRVAVSRTHRTISPARKEAIRPIRGQTSTSSSTKYGWIYIKQTQDDNLTSDPPSALLRAGA
eukprot:COSAG06_NODE_2079_length_7643_cov_20.586957_7_plen_114_part_00